MVLAHLKSNLKRFEKLNKPCTRFFFFVRKRVIIIYDPGELVIHKAARDRKRSEAKTHPNSSALLPSRNAP